jgi:putative transposase
MSGKPSHVWKPYLDIQPNGDTYFRFWQRGGGYDRSIWSENEIIEKLTYMHNNPVKRRLCDTAEEWARSSARHYEGGKDCPIPVETAPL